jgi:hypothetical protein
LESIVKTISNEVLCRKHNVLKMGTGTRLRENAPPLSQSPFLPGFLPSKMTNYGIFLFADKGEGVKIVGLTKTGVQYA